MPGKPDKIVSSSCDAEYLDGADGNAQNPAPVPAGEKRSLTRDYLADFIYNEKNALAVKAAHYLSQKNIADGFPHLSLFYGPSGSGKSHLLKAIYQKRMSHGSFRCHFFSAAQLNPDSAFSCDDTANSAEAAIFIVDDLQELENSHTGFSLITELCDLALKSQKAAEDQGREKFWLVASLSADSLQGASLPDRLRSRLEQGLCFALCPADLDIRLRFVERLNREKNLGLNRSQLINIARQSDRLTEAAGLLRKVEFFITLQGQAPSSRDLDKIIAADSKEPPLDWQRILENVARRLNLKTEDILGSRRKPDHVLGRQVAMYLARSKLALSFQEIGRFFGGKDHSTVMHAVKKIQQLRYDNEDMHKLLKELEK